MGILHTLKIRWGKVGKVWKPDTENHTPHTSLMGCGGGVWMMGRGKSPLRKVGKGADQKTARYGPAPWRNHRPRNQTIKIKRRTNPMPTLSRRRIAPPAPMTDEARAAATAWIAARLVDAPRHRTPVTVLVRHWQDHATTLAIKPGRRSELVALILAAHPAARIRPWRNGRDPSLGKQLHGVVLQ